jgi:hypothetical protein
VDHFEAIIKTLLEHKGHWVRQSFKVNLTKQEKRDIGKHSIPRPEIDLLAYNVSTNSITALEAKSYLDSPGVRYNELCESYDVPEGRYKLFTCKNYRNIVFSRLKKDLIEINMANEATAVSLGLAAGNVYQSKSEDIKNLFKQSHTILNTAGLTIRSRPSSQKYGRALIVTPKKVGSAPVRNRIKRRVKIHPVNHLLCE